MRTIDADALKNIHGMKDDCAECDKELRHKSRSCEFDRVYTLMDFCGWIDDAPTIEPEPKTGKWKYTTHYGDRYRVCPFCNAERRDDGSTGWYFCPCCGADMRGESE